uniref:uncharacterized protein LOC124014310 isoform X2 n=1 Tax=Oncorhynchus gorbuscha TaxID=8017 RepID=UPI001EAE926D|nr:uncharacterized protein LOC124014310 isoform X2 [Oncorhynchus gorbuscha]
MMGCLVVTGVLLVILLFHPPAAQMESPDTDVEAVRFEEFCLKISDDSHCTTAEPERRQTVANKEAAESTQVATSSPSDDKEGIPPGHGELGPIEREGCRCETWQEHTTDRSLVSSIDFRFPATDVCNSTEIMPSTDPDWEGTTTPSPNTSAVSLSPTTQTEEQMRLTPPRELVMDFLFGDSAQAPPGSKGSFGQQGHGLQRCICITKEARRIGKLISKIQFNAPSSRCNVVEIIATLKTSGQEVCLDVTALWVRKILEKLKV